jgi:transposase
MAHRTEVITVERRRRWSEADKRRIVAESLAPGASVSAVARREGLHPSQLFAWRKAIRSGVLTPEPGEGARFAPVMIAHESAATSTPIECRSGRMETVLGRGRRIVVDGKVDAVPLCRVIGVLARR